METAPAAGDETAEARRLQGVDMEKSTSTAYRPALLEEYIAWLRGHLANGGEITHAYDYPFGRWNFLVARRNATIGGECGANAASIIIPEGVSVSGPRGHNNLYSMEDFSVQGNVPIFGDQQFDVLSGVEEARAQMEADRERLWRDRWWSSDLTDYLSARPSRLSGRDRHMTELTARLEVGIAVQVNDGPWLPVREWHQPRDVIETGDPDVGTLPGPWMPPNAVTHFTLAQLEEVDRLPSTRLERVLLRVRTATGDEYDASGRITYVDTSGRVEIGDIRAAS